MMCRVNLGGANKASSVLKNKNLLLVQRFKIGGNTGTKQDSLTVKKSGLSGLSGTFSHIFTYEINKRTYSDSYPEAGFYDSIYINNQSTFDSLGTVSYKYYRFDFATDEFLKI